MYALLETHYQSMYEYFNVKVRPYDQSLKPLNMSMLCCVIIMHGR